MDAIDWYLAFFFGILVLIGLRQSWKLVLRLTSRGFICVLTRYLQYPLLPMRKWWNATRLQALCLAIYIAANLLVLLLSLQDTRQFEQRAATMALINMVPLFIGGRTNPMADALGISIQSYYFAHAWIGRIAIVEAILHSTAVLLLRPRPGSIATSGIIVLSTTAAMIVVTIWILRRFIGDFFQIFHAVLALATLAGTLWHVFSLYSVLAKVLALSCSAFWVLTTITRLLLITIRGRHVRVRRVSMHQDITIINVTTRHHFQGFPGAYFYVTFPGSFWYYDTWKSYPMKAIWKEYPTKKERPESDGTRFSLIISNQQPGSRYLSRLEDRQYILLEGPYGQVLPIQEHENIILVAKGTGLLSLLPLASYLAGRRLHDDAIRSLMQDLPRKEAWIKKAEKDWQTKEKELISDEGELAWKQQQLTRSQKPQRKLSNMLEAESKSLKKERLAIDREKEAIRLRRQEVDNEKIKASIASPFSDSVRRIDLFWLLESNEQVLWAKKYLQHLQKLDANNKLLVVWCVFPSPKRKNSQHPFKQSEHWVCIYPNISRPPFYDMIISNLETESQLLSGQILVVCSGDDSFTNEIRDGVIKLIRPNRLVGFINVEFEQGQGSSSLQQVTERGSRGLNYQSDIEASIVRNSVDGFSSS